MTEIFAHRGASGYAPENTLPAFLLAREQGADGVELDVQLTADGCPVVIHDERIDRVSDGTGFVRDYTLDELKNFSFHNNMEAYRGVTISTLDEVLGALVPGTMKVNIELKTGIFWYPDIETKVLHAVRKADMEERVIYSSFNHYSIQRLLELEPRASAAYLFSDVIVDVEKYAAANRVYALHPAVYHLKMSDFLARYRKAGMKIRVWTVNDEKDMKEFIRAGVDALITNYPDTALKVRGEAENVRE